MSDVFRAARSLMVQPDEVQCQTADMTVTLGADVTLGRALQVLREHHQWLAVDGDESEPVGRLIERNSTGPLRLGYGAWRDLLLGCQFHNGRNELITAGAQTMKNVAGYDLTKFMVGQRGVFGGLATVTVRTYRLPEGALVASFEGNPAHSGDQLNRILTTDCKPQWALIDAEGLTCGYLGNAPTIAYLREGLRRFEPRGIVAHSLEQDTAMRRDKLAQAWADSSDEGTLNFRASIPPARLTELIQTLSPAQWVADGAYGVVWGTMRGDAPTILHQVESLGGGAAIWQQGRYQVGSRPPEAVRQLVRRLKQAFDPDGALMPLPEEYT